MEDVSSIEVLRYQGAAPGPKLVVFGAVHGNEPRGTEGIRRVCQELDAGTLKLLCGSVSFVPIANPPAYKEDRRYLEEDLNRVFRKTDAPTASEAKLANELSMLIDEADVFLDIHTTSAPGPSCVFIDFPTPANRELAGVVGAEYALLSWPELYEHNEFFDSYDTTRYAFEAGKDGIIVETGQHEEEEAANRARLVILRVMRHLGLLEGSAESLLQYRPIRMTALFRKESIEDRFVENWEHLEPIPEGTVIAVRKDGTEIRTGKDLVMLLPKHQAIPGEEWFYLGEEVGTK